MPSRGFTLIELLVVMTIGAILVAVAIPSLSWWIATSRAGNATNAMVGVFELARSEAIRRNTVVSVCRTLNPNAAEASIACSNAAGGGYAAGDWASGWLMFEKRGAGAASVYENGVDFILQRQQPVGNANWRLVMTGNLPGPAVAYDRFGTAASSVGTFSVDYRDPSSATLTGATRCVVVAAVTGRITVNRPTAGAC
jgi:prepilin-type N-terminal cleavage/methylation domain-containing protein